MTWTPQGDVQLPYGFNEDGDLDIHSNSGFCPFAHCPCHEDQTLIAEVNSLYQDGLLTGGEATGVIAGRAF